MPRIHYVKARKDYPAHGVKKGDMHYTWSLKTGPRSSRTYRQIAKPRPSQLTASEFLGALYDWQDSLNAAASMDEIAGLTEELREIGNAEQEKFDNMPEGLQQSDTGQLLESRANACEAAADELEEICGRWEDYDDDEDRRQEWDNAHLDEAKAVSVET